MEINTDKFISGWVELQKLFPFRLTGKLAESSLIFPKVEWHPKRLDSPFQSEYRQSFWVL